jgi:hypothetical protein
MPKFQWRGREENSLMREGALIMLLVLILGIITGHCQTRVRQFPEMTIVRRGNFVIGATIDGYLCYGTRTPLTASCHKAVPEVIYAGE